MLLSSSADNLQPRSSDHAEMSPWHLGGKRYSLLVQNKVQTDQHRSCTRWTRDGEREREMMDAPRLQKNAEKSRTLFFIHLLSDRSDGPFFFPRAGTHRLLVHRRRALTLNKTKSESVQNVYRYRCNNTRNMSRLTDVPSPSQVTMVKQCMLFIYIYIHSRVKKQYEASAKVCTPPSLIFCLYNCLHPYMYKERTEQLCNVHRLHISSWHVSSLFVSFENKRRESSYTPPSSGQVYIQSTLQTIQVSFAALGDVWFGPVLTLINQFSWHWFELSEWIASPF